MIEYQILGGLFDLDKKILREKEINNLMLQDSFWNDREESDKTVLELKNIKNIIKTTRFYSV